MATYGLPPNKHLQQPAYGQQTSDGLTDRQADRLQIESKGKLPPKGLGLGWLLARLGLVKHWHPCSLSVAVH